MNQPTDLSDAALRERARRVLDDLDKSLHEDAVGNLVVGKEMMVSRISREFIALRAEQREADAKRLDEMAANDAYQYTLEEAASALRSQR